MFWNFKNNFLYSILNHLDQDPTDALYGPGSGSELCLHSLCLPEGPSGNPPSPKYDILINKMKMNVCKTGAISQYTKPKPYSFYARLRSEF